MAHTPKSAFPATRPCRAAILAGGLGTRLEPVTHGRPKPLVEVAGHPFIEYVLRQVARAGIQEVVLCAGHGAELVAEALGDGRQLGVSIAYSVEGQPLGTGGALRHASALLGDGPFLVLNGDSFFDIPLGELTEAHAAGDGLPTIALARVAATARFGTVRIDGRGRVTAFAEKAESSGPGLINAGIYILDPAVIDLIPAGRAVSLERDVFPRLIDSGLVGRAFDGFFVDIGVPADYSRLRAEPERLVGATA